MNPAWWIAPLCLGLWVAWMFLWMQHDHRGWPWRPSRERVTWEAYIRRLEKDCGIDWGESWFYDPDVWPIAPAPEAFHNLTNH